MDDPALTHLVLYMRLLPPGSSPQPMGVYSGWGSGFVIGTRSDPFAQGGSC